jgi:hypothetical protein
MSFTCSVGDFSRHILLSELPVSTMAAFAACTNVQIADQPRAPISSLTVPVETAVGAGASEGGLDASNILKPALARAGNLQVPKAFLSLYTVKNVD